MSRADDARKLALALPEASEQDHHGRPSFRVGGKIFATLWDEHHMNVMVDEPGILTAVQAHPDICEEVWWGKRRAAVRVDLRAGETELLSDLLSELLEDAWEQRAPARLARGRPRGPLSPLRTARSRARAVRAPRDDRPAPGT
jgi:hypothetical protein